MSSMCSCVGHFVIMDSLNPTADKNKNIQRNGMTENEKRSSASKPKEVTGQPK